MASSTLCFTPPRIASPSSPSTIRTVATPSPTPCRPACARRCNRPRPIPRSMPSWSPARARRSAPGGTSAPSGCGPSRRPVRSYDGLVAVADSTLPTVAAVNGAAVGAGLNLALAADVRIAGPHAMFDPRFQKLGIHPGGGATWMLQRAVGPQVARAALLFGMRFDAEAAVPTGWRYGSPTTLWRPRWNWPGRTGWGAARGRAGHQGHHAAPPYPAPSTSTCTTPRCVPSWARRRRQSNRRSSPPGWPPPNAARDWTAASRTSLPAKASGRPGRILPRRIGDHGEVRP